MNSANKLNAYRVNAVSTASAENLVVMLYDGAIRFLGMAIRAFEKDDPLDFNLTVHTNITKTQAIIRELSRSLDVEKAGELGHSLVSLYDYFDTRLQEANIRKDKVILEEIIEGSDSSGPTPAGSDAAADYEWGATNGYRRCNRER